MKKLPSHKLEQFQPVKLYIDDLEQMYAVFSEVSHEIKIIADGYELKGLEELPSLKRVEINDFEMKCHDPYISLTLSKRDVSVYIQRDDAMSRGAFDGLRTVLHSAKRPLSSLLQSAIAQGLFIGIAINSLFYGLIKHDGLFISCSICAILLVILWGIAGHRSQFKRFAIIILRHRVDAPSFWDRNSDKIIIAIISTALGAFGTILVSKFKSP